MKKAVLCIVIICLFLCLLPSCAEPLPAVSYNGKEMTEEELFALADALAKAAETESETEAPEPEETEEAADGIVHWTENGAVYHEWDTCSHLSKKDPVQTGSISQAQEAGKERGCFFCVDQ